MKAKRILLQVLVNNEAKLAYRLANVEQLRESKSLENLLYLHFFE